MPEKPVSPAKESVSDLLAAASAMPGIADLMRVYEQHAETVAASKVYTDRTKPQLVITAGASTA
jgi:DUF1680 family protein